MRRLMLLFAAALFTLPLAAQSAVAQQNASQHTTEATTVIEGPQTPGIAPAPPAEPTLMENDAVIRMHTAGLSDDLILQTINAQPGRYDTTPDALISLKKSGLSDGILSAMANKQRRQISGTPLPTGPIDLSPVNEIGVYYKARDGKWTYIEPDLIHMRGGGFLKNIATDGIIKTDQNGRINGKESKLLLARPVEFLVFAPEGVSATEYEMVRFRLNSDNREFRINTGGVIHSHGGADRDNVPITLIKTAPRTWTFTVTRDIPGGEYGILPPGTANVTNGGKIYTFATSE